MMSTKRYSQFDDLITFTRASNGTALRPISYGSESASDANTASNWSAYGSNTVTQDGSAVAVTYVDNSSGANISLSLTAGKVYSVTLDAKINTGSAIFRVYGASSNLVTSSVSSTSFESVSLTFVAESQTLLIFSGLGSGEIITLDNISVKEVTFDQPDGTLTLFNHPNNIPRIEYDSSGNRLGLLIEESRTNLITYSDPSVSFAGSSATLTANQATSPDGTQNAASFTESLDGSPTLHRMLEYTGVDNVETTFSIYVKANGRASFLMCMFDADSTGNSVEVGFLEGFTGYSGLAGYGSGVATAAAIQDVGNGWYRLSVTGTPNASGTGGTILCQLRLRDETNNQSYTGDGVSGAYVWGAQVEAGSFPTSYIATSGATATRSADVASISTDAFGYNQSAGTMFVEASVLNDQNASDRRILEISDGTISNFFSFYQDVSAGENISIANQNGGSLTANFNTGFTITENSIFKAIATLKDNDVAASVNGGSITTDTSTTISSALSEVNIGYLGGGTQQLNGHIKSIRYYPRRLTNAQLVEITS